MMNPWPTVHKMVVDISVPKDSSVDLDLWYYMPTVPFTPSQVMGEEGHVQANNCMWIGG